MVVRARRLFDAGGPMPPPLSWRLDIPDLYESIDGLMGALIADDVKVALADLADVDVVLVPQPAVLHFVGGSPSEEVLNLYGLRPIEGAGTSYGANMSANPSLDLGNAGERQQQIDDWLQQMALDSGFLGMERVLEEYHRRLGRAT